MPAQWSCAAVAERGKLGRIAGGRVKNSMGELRARAMELGSAAGALGGAPAGRRGLGLRRALPGGRERACRGAPPRPPWARASSAQPVRTRSRGAPRHVAPPLPRRLPPPWPPAAPRRLLVAPAASRSMKGRRGRASGASVAANGHVGSDVAVHVGSQRWSEAFWTSSDTLE